MYVTVVRVTKTVRSVNGVRPPRDGYWEVVWKRKRNMGRRITGPLTKKDAVTIASILNSLSFRKAILFVKNVNSLKKLIGIIVTTCDEAYGTN